MGHTPLSLHTDITHLYLMLQHFISLSDPPVKTLHFVLFPQNLVLSCDLRPHATHLLFNIIFGKVFIFAAYSYDEHWLHLKRYTGFCSGQSTSTMRRVKHWSSEE